MYAVFYFESLFVRIATDVPSLCKCVCLHRRFNDLGWDVGVTRSVSQVPVLEFEM